MDYLPRIEVTAPAPRTHPFGIFTVMAEPTQVASGGGRLRWEGGIQWTQVEYDATLREWTEACADNPRGTKTFDRAQDNADFETADAFALYAARKKASITDDTLEAETLAYFNRAKESKVENIFWNDILTGAAEIGMADSIEEAVAILELDHPTDDNGCLHIPRFMYPYLSDDLVEIVDGMVRTKYGHTPVVIGHGYDTYSEVYLTGALFGYRSGPSVFGPDDVRAMNDTEVLVEETFVIGHTYASATKVDVNLGNIGS